RSSSSGMAYPDAQAASVGFAGPRPPAGRMGSLKGGAADDGAYHGRRSYSVRGAPETLRATLGPARLKTSGGSYKPRRGASQTVTPLVTRTVFRACAGDENWA